LQTKKGEPLRDDTIQPTVKHGGGSVMVWGCFMGGRTGDLHRIDGIMNQTQYKSVLQHHAIPSGLRLDGRGFVFQHDNDPKHTANTVKTYIQNKVNDGTMKFLTDWPSQSPDLNPIELVWEEMDRQVAKRKPTNQQQLFEIVNDIWRNMDSEKLLKLCDRMPRVLKACIQAEGGYFDEKYAPRKFKNQPVY
jgi:DDE superfamily endonuclease